ncbi:hypothetical protein [Paraburkholderia sp. SUR17]|uniref:COG4648 family protein n=1 Tax=Paraburkholderia sp. SUR17 TaxID=3034358 RepID=UPI00240825C7|nr:hypothetical protein [Paraburkholderia sp. SUR17]WEY39473.1 hypothetical protein P2869_03610 [Paraburkholderia sp. SUR17]
MSALVRLARAGSGAIVVAALMACQIGTHYAAATPGMGGLGLALVLAPVLAATLGAALRSPRRTVWLALWAAVCATLWAAREPLARHFEWGAWLEHASFNLAMAFMFGRTLVETRIPLCTQFATMMQGPLSPEVARYTRTITAAWTLFFIAMASVSTLLFATASPLTWSTFANYLTLPLAGAMFVVEYACRRIVLPHEPQAGLLASLRAYREASDARAHAMPERAQ